MGLPTKLDGSTKNKQMGLLRKSRWVYKKVDESTKKKQMGLLRKSKWAYLEYIDGSIEKSKLSRWVY